MEQSDLTNCSQILERKKEEKSSEAHREKLNGEICQKKVNFPPSMRTNYQEKQR